MNEKLTEGQMKLHLHILFSTTNKTAFKLQCNWYPEVMYLWS